MRYQSPTGPVCCHLWQKRRQGDVEDGAAGRGHKLPGDAHAEQIGNEARRCGPLTFTKSTTETEPLRRSLQQTGQWRWPRIAPAIESIYHNICPSILTFIMIVSSCCVDRREICIYLLVGDRASTSTHCLSAMRAWIGTVTGWRDWWEDWRG